MIAGDRVKCIDSKDTLLIKNHIYTVKFLEGKYVYLEESIGAWKLERFELIGIENDI